MSTYSITICYRWRILCFEDEALNLCTGLNLLRQPEAIHYMTTEDNGSYSAVIRSLLAKKRWFRPGQTAPSPGRRASSCRRFGRALVDMARCHGPPAIRDGAAWPSGENYSSHAARYPWGLEAPAPIFRHHLECTAVPNAETGYQITANRSRLSQRIFLRCRNRFERPASGFSFSRLPKPFWSLNSLPSKSFKLGIAGLQPQIFD